MLSCRSILDGLRIQWLVIVVFGLTVEMLGGCATSRTAEETAADRSRVLGTWEYQTDGIRSLQEGILKIQMDDGELVGRFQDNWRGQIDAKVNLHGSHMELYLHHFRIRGRLEQGRFTGSVHRPTWDVTQSDVESGSSGSFVARRVRSAANLNASPDFGCTSLLRESSYACSPLQSP